MTAEQLTLDAEQAKREGMEAADNAASFLWRDEADAAVARAAASGEVFDAYALVARFGCPEPRHPNAWGPALLRNARAGVIAPAGVGPSTRPTTAKSLVRLWRGVPKRSAVRQPCLCDGCAAP